MFKLTKKQEAELLKKVKNGAMDIGDFKDIVNNKKQKKDLYIQTNNKKEIIDDKIKENNNDNVIDDNNITIKNNINLKKSGVAPLLLGSNKVQSNLFQYVSPITTYIDNFKVNSIKGKAIKNESEILNKNENEEAFNININGLSLFKIDIDIKHMSFNVYNSLNRKEQIKLKMKIKNILEQYITKNNIKFQMINEKVKIHITICITKKNRKDIDNIVIMTMIFEKFIIDILKNKIIIDDSPEYISEISINVKYEEKEKIIINFS